MNSKLLILFISNAVYTQCVYVLTIVIELILKQMQQHHPRIKPRIRVMFFPFLLDVSMRSGSITLSSCKHRCDS